MGGCTFAGARGGGPPHEGGVAGVARGVPVPLLRVQLLLQQLGLVCRERTTTSLFSTCSSCMRTTTSLSCTAYTLLALLGQLLLFIKQTHLANSFLFLYILYIFILSVLFLLSFNSKPLAKKRSLYRSWKSSKDCCCFRLNLPVSICSGSRR